MGRRESGILCEALLEFYLLKRAEMQIFFLDPASYPLCQGGWMKSLLRVSVELFFLGLWKRLALSSRQWHTFLGLQLS